MIENNDVEMVTGWKVVSFVHDKIPMCVTFFEKEFLLDYLESNVGFTGVHKIIIEEVKVPLDEMTEDVLFEV